MAPHQEVQRRIRKLFNNGCKSDLAEKTSYQEYRALKLELQCATTFPKWKTPFGLMAKGLSRPEWLTRLGDFRNWLMPSGEVEILKNLVREILVVIV